ncbi:MAG: hypothetical protein AB2669_03395 [Candidatus Thiodiazotropha endolucinida]|nr:hypothetical protein [Candidatus Thiodiazotropha taylori]MCW4224866.1 hypothetical protein [Candidatus Thiodiazotropha endolucinida]MCG7883940.1 hypothetical protein [Candidatus Thiodiazotropha taylori]MCG7886439.1 hypothetical protein [Candidatus Thiodiazotropha taylori]MCG7888717.1 hypothetical protein [Candidatus Thiodiazotropha taylori]
MNEEYDKKLWVEIKPGPLVKDPCLGKKHYLVGNPHTRPGRVMVYCPITKKCHVNSFRNFVKLSDEAQYWMQGFLSGNEPHPPLGSDGMYDFTDKEWVKRIESFHKTGEWDTEHTESASDTPSSHLRES